MKPENNRKIKRFKESVRFLSRIKAFLFFWVVFSVGLFLGEWLLDFIFSSERNTVGAEVIGSVVTGLIVAVFLTSSPHFIQKTNK